MTDTPRQFQPIQNPYIVGNPIRDQKMFFGREDDFNFIRQRVSGDRMSGLIVLCGSRRSGKTSILFQVMNGRLGDEFFPVLIDMQAMTVENDLDFYIKLGEGILDAIKDPDISLQRDFLDRRDEGKLSAFQYLIGKVMSRLGGKRLVLLFDEYEIFESHIAKNLISTQVLDVFSNWLDHKEGVFMVFTGSDRLEERDERVWGRFLQKGEHQRISFLSRNDAFRLINDPLQDVIEYEEGVPEKIWELTSGQPFYTQVFCQALVDHLNEVREYRIEMDDLRDVVEQVIENPLPQMIFAWNSLSNLEKIGTSIIGELYGANGEPVTADEILSFAKNEKIGYQIDPNGLREALEKLFTHDMLTKDASGEGYAFKMGLWQRWIDRMHSIWQVIDEVKNSEELGDGLVLQKSKPVRVFAAVAAAVVLVAGSAIVSTMLGDKSADTVGIIVPLDSTHITVTTDPPGAEVFLGQQRIGTSPVSDVKVMAGTMLMSVELDGYHTVRDSVTLHKDVPLTIPLVVLREETGALRVTSSPDGADVYVNGRRTGRQTPTTLSDLSVNRVYEIQLRLSNFQAKTYPAEAVVADSTRDLPRHNFQAAYDGVRIDSEPTGATVLIDGVEKAKKTPDVYSMTHGSHEVVIRMYGYHDSVHKITVSSSTKPVKAVLTRLPKGTLIIMVKPYAKVEIDGVEIGKDKGRYEHAIDVGTYTITFIHPTFGKKEETVTVESGKEQVVSVEFDNPEGSE
jgi:AAA+ ATPase superfamily predicted ATPase